MIILDTNVVSELMSPSPNAQVALWFQAHASEAVATSTVTIAEITYGLARLPQGARRKNLEASFAQLIGPGGPLPVFDIGTNEARLCGLLRAERGAIGRPMTLADAMIAAIALAQGSHLATRNTRDFEGLGLSLLDPWV